MTALDKKIIETARRVGLVLCYDGPRDDAGIRFLEETTDGGSYREVWPGADKPSLTIWEASCYIEGAALQVEKIQELFRQALREEKEHEKGKHNKSKTTRR